MCACLCVLTQTHTIVENGNIWVEMSYFRIQSVPVNHVMLTHWPHIVAICVNYGKKGKKNKKDNCHSIIMVKLFKLHVLSLTLAPHYCCVPEKRPDGNWTDCSFYFIFCCMMLFSSLLTDKIICLNHQLFITILQFFNNFIIVLKEFHCCNILFFQI